MHSLWINVCLIRPCLRALSIITDHSLCNNKRKKGLLLLRYMVNQVDHAQKRPEHLNSSAIDLCGGCFVKTTFHQSSFMSVFGIVREENELSRHFSNAVTTANRNVLQ